LVFWSKVVDVGSSICTHAIKLVEVVVVHTTGRGVGARSFLTTI
jgi:hypothetical protein